MNKLYLFTLSWELQYALHIYDVSENEMKCFTFNNVKHSSFTTSFGGSFIRFINTP